MTDAKIPGQEGEPVRYQTLPTTEPRAKGSGPGSSPLCSVPAERTQTQAPHSTLPVSGTDALQQCQPSYQLTPVSQERTGTHRTLHTTQLQAASSPAQTVPEICHYGNPRTQRTETIINPEDFILQSRRALNRKRSVCPVFFITGNNIFGQKYRILPETQPLLLSITEASRAGSTSSPRAEARAFPCTSYVPVTQLQASNDTFPPLGDKDKPVTRHYRATASALQQPCPRKRSSS